MDVKKEEQNENFGLKEAVNEAQNLMAQYNSQGKSLSDEMIKDRRDEK